MADAMTKRSILILLVVVLPIVVMLIRWSTPGVRTGRHERETFASNGSVIVLDVTLSDPQSIAELNAVHSRSTSATPRTVPSDMVAVHVAGDGLRRFKFLYGAGCIWEMNEEGEITERRMLNETDRKWMEENMLTKTSQSPNSF